MNIERYCLWLQGLSTRRIKAMPKVLERVEKVQRISACKRQAPEPRKAG